jgi:hypothetical protein
MFKNREPHNTAFLTEHDESACIALHIAEHSTDPVARATALLIADLIMESKIHVKPKAPYLSIIAKIERSSV